MALAYAIALSTKAWYRSSPLRPAWLTKSGLVVASVMCPVSAYFWMTSRSPESIESTVMPASCSSCEAMAMPAPRLWLRAGGTVEPRLNASIRTSASASILSLCDILGSDEELRRTRLPCAPPEVLCGFALSSVWAASGLWQCEWLA